MANEAGKLKVLNNISNIYRLNNFAIIDRIYVFLITEPGLNNSGSGNVGPPSSSSRKSKSWSLRKMVMIYHYDICNL